MVSILEMEEHVYVSVPCEQESEPDSELLQCPRHRDHRDANSGDTDKFCLSVHLLLRLPPCALE